MPSRSAAPEFFNLAYPNGQDGADKQEWGEENEVLLDSVPDDFDVSKLPTRVLLRGEGGGNKGLLVFEFRRDTEGRVWRKKFSPGNHF